MHALVVALTDVATRDKPLDPNDVKPGWLALGIVVLLCIAVFILCRSFIKHAKKAERPWDGEQDGAERTTPHNRN